MPKLISEFKMEFMNIYKVIEFSDFFINESIDIKETLKRFSREKLVDAVSVMSINYGNAYLPNPQMPFFSDTSRDKMEKLNSLFNAYSEKQAVKGYQRFYYSSYRTILELIRYIYSIPYEDFIGDIRKEDFEYELFRVLTTINEDLYNDIPDTNKLPEIMFYMEYSMNDMNMSNISDTVRTQALYCKRLFDFLEKSPKAGDLYKRFLKKYGITHWHQYASTINCLIFHLNICSKQEPKVNPKLSIQDFPSEMKNRISLSVLDNISIGIDEYVAYDSNDNKDRNNNVDYRMFRSRPLIKGKDGYYNPVNYQMICELMYNSLFFVLSELYGKDFNSSYNKRFVEEYLFHRTMLKICKNSKKIARYFPSESQVLSDEIQVEEKDQPDFYACYHGDIFLFECKAFKLNGTFKEKGKMTPMIDALYKKVVHGINQRGKDEDLAIRQLNKHCHNIHIDDFRWDKQIPDEVTYYPVLVLEDPKIANAGAASLIQDWNNIELWGDGENKRNPIQAYSPIVTVSIDTLFLYSDVFKKRGFEIVFEDYFKNCANFNDKKGWTLSSSMSFNQYMKKYGFREKKFYDGFVKEIMEHS